MLNTFIKDPDAVLDYKFDWKAATNETGLTDWLEDNETIISKTLIASTGLTIDSSAYSDADTSVTVWLSGGARGKKYRVTCRITTSQGREDDRSIFITVLER